jgi:hypothetical protein
VLQQNTRIADVTGSASTAPAAAKRCVRSSTAIASCTTPTNR